MEVLGVGHEHDTLVHYPLANSEILIHCRPNVLALNLVACNTIHIKDMEKDDRVSALALSLLLLPVFHGFMICPLLLMVLEELTSIPIEREQQ